MIARGARLDPARAGKIGRQRAADRAAARGTAEQPAVIDRLERQLLAALGDQRRDLGERRAGLGRQHQFVMLVERDAGQARQIECQFGLARTPDRALGSRADKLERLVMVERPAHGLLDVLGIARLEGVGHRDTTVI